MRLACLVLALAAWPAGAPAAAVAPDSAASAGAPPGPALSRYDAAFGLVSAGAVALVATHDRELRERAHDSGGRTGRDFARAGNALGDGGLLAPSLLAFDGLARLSQHPNAGAASERVALSAGVAGLASVAVKLAVGRWRPFESPRDDGRFDPFTHHDSFPSGHATLAFACAAALAAETHSRVVRVVAWPVAALVGWARMHDDRHWASDVVAGAAVGAWTGREVDAFAHRRWPHGLAVAVWPTRDGASARVQLRF